FGVPGGAALLIAGQSRVSQDAIQTSVTRTAELIDSAWELPVAATFNADVTWQSNGSRCGPASVANTFRS
ncbi:MAG: phytochelatin synthase, partial [Mesorhizobium sp.]